MVEIIASQIDITTFNGDAIVNAANSSLLGGSGVDGKIHRAAGKELAIACGLLRGCKPGKAKLTLGFKLPVKYIIHTVGPYWSGGFNNEENVLISCYTECLQLAELHNINSICFPCISTGIFKFPKKLAANIAVNTIKQSGQNFKSIKFIEFCCFDNENYDIYNHILHTQT